MSTARLLLLISSAIAVLVLPLAAAGTSFVVSHETGASALIFKPGYNKCKLASVAAISRAAGKAYAKGRFDGKTCTWSSSDGNYVVLVDSHPPGYLDFMVPSVGKHAGGELVRVVSVPGASKAVLDEHPYANTHRYEKDLFAVYPQGVVQVSLDYSTKLSDSALVAVMRLVTHP